MEKVIRLEGRIDGVNGSKVEKEIFAQLDDSVTKVIFDAEKLNYISSMGLRIVLRAKKQFGDVSVINAQPEVYDIFEITGYTSFMPITKALREISIEGCEKIGEGFFGSVYRLDDETVVKVYNIPDAMKMIKRETELAKKAFMWGVSTAISYDIVKVGDKFGAVYELLHAKSIKELIKSEKALKAFCKKSVETLRQIHSIEVSNQELPSRREQVIEMIYDSKEFLQHQLMDKLVRIIATIPESETVLHSDFHIKNVMMQGDELLLIDMETLSRGHPIFEFAAMHSAYIAFACVNKNNTMEFFGIPLELSEKIFNLIFEGYYSDKTPEEREDMLKKISVISYLKVLSTRAVYGDKTNPLIMQDIQYSVNYLEKMMNQLDTLYY